MKKSRTTASGPRLFEIFYSYLIAEHHNVIIFVDFQLSFFFNVPHIDFSPYFSFFLSKAVRLFKRKNKKLFFGT